MLLPLLLLGQGLAAAPAPQLRFHPPVPAASSAMMALSGSSAKMFDTLASQGERLSEDGSALGLALGLPGGGFALSTDAGAHWRVENVTGLGFSGEHTK